MSELDAFRAAKDRFFKAHPRSPLTEAQRQTFTGLRYFPENAPLRLALPVERFESPSTIVLPTSAGDTRTYRRLGRVRFTIDGQDAALTLFADEAGALFLPFADTLAGGETYGAGRYLDPEPLGDGRVLVDFNLAYNPSCAYNDGWSCPITPAENRLKVAIRAGEQIFPDAVHTAEDQETAARR
ncbi:MAG TPA: DUF1684 domain-containing protein [Roseiflexaceae bacterium]|nr:DUF1684 domain-containing protein [Roseiflexaceae bacterium]